MGRLASHVLHVPLRVHARGHGCGPAEHDHGNAGCADAFRPPRTSADSRKIPRQNKPSRNQPKSSPSSASTVTRPITRVRLQSFEQAVGKPWSIENRAHQQKGFARVLLASSFDKDFTQFAISSKALGTLQQPHIELAFHRAQVGSQFRVIALGVIPQKSGMNFEKLGQQGTRRLSHVSPRSALNLRDIRLADALAQLRPDALHQFNLGHWAVQSPERSFNLAQVANFLGESHIPYRNIYIAICNAMSRTGFPSFSEG